jgi:hypothetical protein
LTICRKALAAGDGFDAAETDERRYFFL